MTQEDFFARYTYNIIQDKIGVGAFGTVYKAYDNVEQKYSAVKISEVKTFGTQIISLATEFEAVKSLSEHKNIARIDDIYTFQQPTGTFDFILMDYYPDGNLNEFLSKTSLDQKEKENIATQILDGLEFLHTNHIIHGNLKPSNILMEQRQTSEGTDYTPKITDFGLGKFFRTNTGSHFSDNSGEILQFCSPEQLKGQNLGYNSDLWSWAVMSYKLITGNDLISFSPDDNEMQNLSKIMEEDFTPRLNTLSEKWRNTLFMALQRDPEKRTQTAGELKTFLSDVFSDQNTPKNQDEEDFSEVVPEEFEVPIMKDIPPVAPPQKVPPKVNATKAIIPTKAQEEPRHSKWLYLLLLLLIPFVYYGYKNISVDNGITEKNAKNIYENMLIARSKGDYNAMKDVFAVNLDKYYNRNDVNRADVISDMEDYNKKWSIENIEVTDFGKTVKDMFHYSMTYSLRDRKTFQLTKYNVSGEVGFKKEADGYRINYITDRSTSNETVKFSYGNIVLIRQQDFTSYRFNYSQSVLYLPDIKESSLLDFIYSPLSESTLGDYSRSNLQQILSDNYDKFLVTTGNKMSDIVADSTLRINQKAEMSIAFVDNNFLCVKFSEDFAYDADRTQTLICNNVDYVENKILSLGDILNINTMPWTEIISRSIENGFASVNGRTIYPDEVQLNSVSYPHNFYFDTQKIYFIYDKSETPMTSEQGPITIAMPLSGVQDYLSSYFKEKISNSNKVNIIKL